MYPVASTKLSDVLKVRSVGETVNVHVVKQVKEPQPDFAAMKKTIENFAEQEPAPVKPDRG